MHAGSNSALAVQSAVGERTFSALPDRSMLSRRESAYLNRRLSIFKALILSSRVEGDMASLTAAPDGPETRPLLSASATSTISRSLCGLASRDAGRETSLESHNSSIENASPELRITDLSIT